MEAELESIVKCESTPQPVSPDPRSQNQRLVQKYNVTYIVAAVLFEGDKVLLIQEAKPSCSGDWYLPAGRMEPDETIVEAVKREVKEESGLTFQPEAVIAVECWSHRWIRITLTGRVDGGSLKTTAQADKESLQAGWFSQQQLRGPVGLNLRAGDILPLIEAGRRWSSAGSKSGGLPVEMGHVSSFLRLILIAKDSKQLLVLVRTAGNTTHFPVVTTDFADNIQEGLKSCGYRGAHKVRGVLSLEHLGRPHGSCDGICISVLVEASTRDLDKTGEYHWTPVEQGLEARLRDALSHCAELNPRR